MNNWQKYFSPHIWLRGAAYYEDGAVELGYRSGDCYTAVVSGSEDYDVEIELRGKQIQYMDCSCPYAAEGNNCKHMAAVLMALEEDADVPQQASLSPMDLVKRIPEAELRSLLASLLEENAALYRRLQLRYGEPSQTHTPQISRLRAELNAIPEEYEDRYGEIDYDSAYDFACDIAAFIENQAFFLARSDSVLASACLGWEAVTLYCEQEVDDSDGGSSCVSDAIHTLYVNLLQLCSKSEKLQLFRETETHYLNPDCHWLMEEMVRDILLSDIWRTDLRKEQLQFLDEEISRLEASPEKHQWRLEHTILARLDAIDGGDLRALHSYMDAHLNVPDIRKRRAELYLKDNDSENAIRLLLEGKKQAQEAKHYGTERDFSHLLINAYEETGQLASMLQELEFYLFQYRQDDLVMLLRMKASTSPTHWEALRARYLSHKDTMQKGELMRHEQMWDALLEYVLQSNSIWAADHFEADLKNRFPDEMLAFYQRYLVCAAESASNRKSYYSLMPYMKKLCKYPGGKEAAVQLAADWRVRYRRRPAMLDELQKAGF